MLFDTLPRRLCKVNTANSDTLTHPYSRLVVLHISEQQGQLRKRDQEEQTARFLLHICALAYSSLFIG